MSIFEIVMGLMGCLGILAVLYKEYKIATKPEDEYESDSDWVGYRDY